MKKTLFISLLLILVFIMCACSNQETPNSDALPFTSYKEVQLSSNEKYIIYSEDEYDFFYEYEELTIPNNLSTWTINYYYVYDYIINCNYSVENIFDSIYLNVTELINEYQAISDVQFETNKYNTIEERQFTFENIDENQKLYLINMFIPVKIIYRIDSNKYNFNLLIPVYTYKALKINDNISFGNVSYIFNEFINNPNVFKK